MSLDEAPRDPLGSLEPDANPPVDEHIEEMPTSGEADLQDEDGVNEELAEKRRREREARAQALTLEMMGDLPFAEVKPPENVLFVCKLNPVTADEDLELIFGRFGKIVSCEVIRDHKTGDSLQYAFIEYDEKASCEAAYFKMQGVLIDDRRIHVDFSQSVSKLSDVWRKDTNRRRRANVSRGGWGGVKELEKRRHYRHQQDKPSDSKEYDIVYGKEEMRARHERTGQNSAQDSPSRPSAPYGETDSCRPRYRSRSRSPRRNERDRSRDRRDWNRRDRGRDRDRDSGWGRDSGRDRDRDRDRDRRRNGSKYDHRDSRYDPR